MHQFRVGGDPAVQAEAIRALEAAVDHWRAYGEVASSQYKEQVMARTRSTDWLGVLLDGARRDVEIARAARPGVMPE